MRRRVAIAGLIMCGLLAPLGAAGPASAVTGVGCNGSDCSILLSRMIKISGDDAGAPSAQVPLNVQPPPCLWEPIGDAITGSNYIIGQFGDVTQGDSLYGVYQSVKQAKQEIANGGQPAGTWYQLPVNPAASAAGQAACLKLPLFYFVQPGQALPAVPIPPRTLAAYAYNHMTIPAPTITVNPQNKSYVNLGTYVWGNWAPSPTTGQMDAYKITATLIGTNETVTVWAQPAATNPFTVNVGGPGTASSAGCGPTGSQYPVSKPPAGAGAGTPPDCGVLWQGPDTAATVSATVNWTVTWGLGDLNGPGNRPLPAIDLTGPAVQFPVDEIQSVNNG